MARIKVQVPGGNFKSIQTGGGSTVVQQTIVQQRVAAPAPIGSTGGGTTISSANPSATIGLAAVDGTATTFMTSDSAPPLSQAIAPTWTGLHTFTAAVVIDAPASGPSLTVLGDINGADIISLSDGTTTAAFYTASGVGYFGTTSNDALYLATDAIARIQIAATGGVSINAPASDVPLTVDIPTSGGNRFNGIALSYGGSVVGYIGGDATDLVISSGSGEGGSYLDLTSSSLILGTSNTGRLTVGVGGGFTLDAPTGGNEGIGTINVAGGYYVNGVALTAGGGASNIQTFTQAGGTSQSYTVPANAHWLRIIAIGGGGGGGGGARSITAAEAGSGAGGSAGCVSIQDLLASDAGSTLTLTFSSTTGGAGGAGSSGASAGNGSGGTNGATATVKIGSNIVTAAGGGAAGGGGTTSAGGGASATTPYGNYYAGNSEGGNGSVSSGSGGGALSGTLTAFNGPGYGPTGGGGGGGTNGSSNNAGGAGGSNSGTAFITVTGGTGGTNAGGVGGNNGTSGNPTLCGPGGGGGGSGVTTHNGGSGASPTTPGAGGGGGGACGNGGAGTTGGAGGTGGVATIIILAW